MGAVREVPVLPAVEADRPPLQLTDLIQLNWEVVVKHWPASQCSREEISWFDVVALRPSGAPGIATAIPICWGIKNRAAAEAIASLPKILRALKQAHHLPSGVHAASLADLILSELASRGVTL